MAVVSFSLGEGRLANDSQTQNSKKSRKQCSTDSNLFAGANKEAFHVRIDGLRSLRRAGGFAQ